MARPSGRRTFTEQARRDQLIEATIDLVARHGYAGCSLQRIADAAGITKAAVIYHFASKNEVIKAAYDSVVQSMIAHVGHQVEAAATAEAMVEAYLTSMIDYVRLNPRHIRMIIEAMVESAETGVEEQPTSPGRVQGLANLIDAAKADDSYRKDVDSSQLAIILGGAVDAIAAASLTNPDLDLTAATATLLDLLHHGARQPT
jgi:AcrR family transcriptional regulator